MALQFNCKHCNELVVVKFLKVGEIGECKKCGKKNTIPENAEGISESKLKSEHTISDAFDTKNNEKGNLKGKETSTSKSKTTKKTKNKEPMDVFVDNVHPINVTVRDIEMSFTSMVMFMVKWAIASIPALIILFIIFNIIIGVFGLGIFALFK